MISMETWKTWRDDEKDKNEDEDDHDELDHEMGEFDEDNMRIVEEGILTMGKTRSRRTMERLINMR